MAKAKIRWISESEGGRAEAPVGPRYVTVSRFEDEREKYPAEAWSLVVELLSQPDSTGNTVSEVTFLADDAPSHLLYPGSKFDLFEGARHVASGVVLSQ